MRQIQTPASEESRQSPRRLEILEAAAELFAEKGYQRATMKEIAARAGIAPGTIYLYFDNKRDLFLAIADHLIAQSVDQTLTQSTQMDPEEFIATLLRERMRFARENSALLQALVSEVWTDLELQSRFFTQVIGPVLAAGAGYLRGQIAAGKLRECRVEVIVPAMAGSIVFLAAFRSLAPEYILAGIPEEEAIEELTRFYLHGLTPRMEETVE